jgi:phosphatidylglycerophosphate synthase
MVETINNSCTANFLNRHHFELILAYIPKSVPPNAITLFGMASCIGIPLLMLLGTPGDWPGFGLACAVATYLYAGADQLDGLQARRTGSGSYRGAILDHLCDFVNGSLVILGGFWATGASVSALTLVSTIFILSFSISHLEAVTRGELRLGIVGPLESLLIAMLFFVLMSIPPTRAFLLAPMPNLGGISVYWLPVGYLLYNCAGVVRSTAARLRYRLSGQYVAFACLVGILAVQGILSSRYTVTALLIWTVMMVYAAGYVLELLTADRGDVPRPGTLAPIGVTLAMMAHSVLGLPTEALNPLLAAMAIGFAVPPILISWQLPRVKMDVA